MQTLEAYLPGLLKTSGQASFLIVLVLLAQRACGARLQPRWRCALWLLVLLRLGLPWTIPSPASLFNVLKLPVMAQPVPAETVAAPLTEAPPVVSHEPSSAMPAAHGQLLVWLWLIGALSLAGCAVSGHFKIHRRVAELRPCTNEETLNLLEDCKGLMGIHVPVALIEMDGIDSPTLFGFVRPRLLLPAGLVANFSRAELRHVFLHELAHIKRNDILAGWAMLVLQAIHWFNPLVWLAFYRLRADRELACDALALSCGTPGENQTYGLTIVKLLEGFGRSVWTPSLAGILENKHQLKERISMIAKFHKTNRGFALAVTLFAGLALVALTDAQNAPKPPRAQAEAPEAGKQWNLQQKIQMAEGGNDWATYDLWDTFFRGKHGVQADPAEASKWLEKLLRNVWVVRFEPVEDFAPTSPGEFLSRIHKYSSSRSGQNNIGAASFFRTTIQGDKLVGSFLSNYPEDLKASLSKVPGLKITSSEKMTAQDFIKYEQSPQESLWSLPAKIKSAEAGNDWATYDVWDAYFRGNHGVQRDPAEANKWLEKLVQNVWIVRFEPIGHFAPNDPGEFLGKINQYASCRSGQNNIGAASFFRTAKQGDKLVGSFLSSYPDRLKACLAKVPGVKVTSVEQITPEEFIKYEQSPQESL